MAASRLLKGEGGVGQVGTDADLFYPLERLNSMVQCLITTHPSLVLLWCQVLLIINYTNYSWWAEVHQTPRLRDHVTLIKLKLINSCLNLVKTQLLHFFFFFLNFEMN